MTNMQGKVILVTGATNGIGLEAARVLARMGAHVAIVGRNPQKTRDAAATLTQETGGDVTPLIGDLSVLAGVHQVAEAFKTQFDRLDVLLNNAGAVFNTYQRTADGYEMTFALNHLNYFLLTHLLLDMLKASAPARIVNVSSDAHRVGKMDFDNLQAEKRFGGFRAYGMSKLANVMFTYELARRLEGTGITVNALHPGFVRSGFGHNTQGLMGRLMPLIQIGAITVEKGAETSVYLASSPEVEGVTGKYFVKSKPVASSKASYNEADWRRLWEVSEKLTGVQTTAPA